MFSNFIFLAYFSGGDGGMHSSMNGQGGWSYYNPDAILKVIGPSVGPTKCSEDSGLQIKDEHSGDEMLPNFLEDVPTLCKVVGDGMVQILSPSEYTEALCHGNCSAKGATCVALDMEAKIGACICPNGIILNHINPQCTNGE